ncbi:MAG: hypothetical protein F6J90_28540 [Moorea sp. SIOASIH]|uniref:hypothetical protein n=1 Tax=Moorena sp. SIOASIH TaxID=2607817 RepID=UPI0013B6BD9A|nr:hypothetical protein [Moorena sp. SIOASIH]NEO40072.1 hypothetical protein [Moorena sp. SIOASIH]
MVKKSSQLADLEALTLNVHDQTVRAYVEESIASYSVGAYRSAIVSIWTAVVYDLYQKVRYLDEQYGDKAAKICIESIDKIRKSPDKKQVSAWERTILKDGYEKIKMFTLTEYEHLERIQQDRHRCAHPVLDSDGFLFQPSPELTRSHIRTAVDVLFSQPPIIGKPAVDALERDVETSVYFPNKLEDVSKALKNRHILSTSNKYRVNLFKFCLKKILYLDINKPEFINRYILVFNVLIYEDRGNFESIDRKVIASIFDNAKEERYNLIVELFNIAESLWNDSSDFFKEKFKIFLKESATNEEKVRVLHIFPELEKELLKYVESSSVDTEHYKHFISLITGLDTDRIKRIEKFIKRIIRHNIDLYCKSKSWYQGEKNAVLIERIIDLLKEEDINYLLEQAVIQQEMDRNDQLNGTTDTMINLFEKTINKFPNTINSWHNFIKKKRNRNWYDLEKLEQKIANYDSFPF